MAECVDAYMKSLRPVPSPYLVDGELSEKAKAGRKVFDKLKCGDCHNGPFYTDLKMHRIGEDVEFEKGWDTPTLVECWRTAPYLFDGSVFLSYDNPRSLQEKVRYIKEKGYGGIFYWEHKCDSTRTLLDAICQEMK